MLNAFDLYDLHAIFVNIRNNESNPLNHDIVFNTLQVIKKRSTNFSFNQFRNALLSLELSNCQEYAFVFTQNTYPYIPFLLKDENVYELLECVCDELLDVINGCNYVQIKDLADAIHNLPLLLVENNSTIPDDFWKYEIDFYRNKWNKSFLTAFKNKL